ncbi:MAG: ATP-binding protein [Haloferacaceae archaeon]
MADSAPDGTVRLLYVGDGDGRAATALEAADDRFRVATASGAREGLERAAAERFDCVVSAVELSDGRGTDLLEQVADRRPGVATVLVDGEDGDAAAEAVRAGVTDYVRAGDDDRLAARVEAAVETQRERAEILDRMTDAFIALDDEWRFTYLNERGRRVICRAADVEATADELLGESIWELIPDAVDTTFHEQYHRAMETGESVTFEEEYEPLGVWFEVRAYPSATGLSVYLRDVTERKERERERVLTRIHRVLADKGASLDAKVQDLLAIGREVLGTEYGALSRVKGDDYVFEVVDDPTGSVQPGDVVPLEATSCERAIATEETLVLADVAADAPELADRAGYTEWGIECYVGTPVTVDGEVYGTFCFYDRQPRTEPFDDWEVTVVELMGDWISYEQERGRRQRELERERDRLDSFASMVSHDLRNPLNVAGGNLDLLAAECESDHIDDVRRALDRMNELIDDMLAVARSGQQVEDPEPVDIGRTAREAWATVEHAGATLAVEEAATVSGDEGRLRQLFENLFRNSIEHGDAADGGVTVRVGVLDGGRGFYVEDDGPGIPEDRRERAFRSGYSTRERGTGFGLAIVAEIVKAHGGEVTVTEGRDGGARFEVTGVDAR